MEQKIYLDFWNPETILEGLSKIYNVSEAVIRYLVNAYDDEKMRLSQFFEFSNIHPDTYPLDNIMIRCKLIGKYPDKTQLEQYGLLPLTNILQDKESFLSQYLCANGIVVDVEKGTFTYRENTIKIERGDSLGNKLYHDGGEVEAFYCGEEKTMVKYSCVKNYPEILDTIDQYVYRHFGVKPDLGTNWSTLTTGYDIISFYIDLKDTSYIGEYSDYWGETVPYEDYYEIEYLTTDSYPKLLYLHLWLLKMAFYVLDGGVSERYIGIKNNVVLPYSILEIEHFDEE